MRTTAVDAPRAKRRGGSCKEPPFGDAGHERWARAVRGRGSNARLFVLRASPPGVSLSCSRSPSTSRTLICSERAVGAAAVARGKNEEEEEEEQELRGVEASMWAGEADGAPVLTRRLTAAVEEVVEVLLHRLRRRKKII